MNLSPHKMSPFCHPKASYNAFVYYTVELSKKIKASHFDVRGMPTN
jgi:hypothetical protein